MAQEDIVIGVSATGIDESITELNKVTAAQQRIAQQGDAQATAAASQARAVTQAASAQAASVTQLGSRWGQFGSALGQVGGVLGHISPQLGSLGGILGQVGGATSSVTTAFGPFGIAIGIATAAVGILVPLLSDTADETHDVGEEARKSAQSIRDLTEAFREQARMQRTLAGQGTTQDANTLVEQARAREANARSQLTAAERRVRDIEQRQRGGGSFSERAALDAEMRAARAEVERLGNNVTAGEARVERMLALASQTAVMELAQGAEADEQASTVATEDADDRRRARSRSGAHNEAERAARELARVNEQRRRDSLQVEREGVQFLATIERQAIEAAERLARAQEQIRGEGTDLTSELDEYRGFVDAQGQLDGARAAAFQDHLHQREDDHAAHVAALRDVEAMGTEWTAEEFQRRLSLHREMLSARRDAERAAASEAQEAGREQAQLQREETAAHNKLMGQVVSTSLAPIVDGAGQMFRFLAEGAEGGTNAFVALLDKFLEATAIEYSIRALGEFAQAAASAASLDPVGAAAHAVAGGLAVAVAAATGIAGAAIQSAPPTVSAGGAASPRQPAQLPPDGGGTPFVVNIYASATVFTEHERQQLLAQGAREVRRNSGRRIRS